MPKSSFAKRLLQTTILASAAVAVAAPAMAQDDQIVITGSRIKRADLESPSPVTTIGAQELRLVNTVNTEQFLNGLPQAIPGLDSSSNNPGNGTASVNLRGLGSNRTLVLVDGYRYVVNDTSQVVDLNSIPAALVERVDVVTGGASAVYGSDALAGVVNFILKKDFEGFEVGTSYEITEESDGAIFDINFIAGGNFADGRGNAVLSVGYTDRDEVFQGDRAFGASPNQDNGPGMAFTPFGSSGIPGTRVFSTFDFTSIGFEAPTFGAATPMMNIAGMCTTEGLATVDPDGSLTFDDMTNLTPSISGDEFCGGGATFNAAGDPIPFINAGVNTSRYNYAPVNYLQLPQERYNLASFVTYDITDKVTLNLRGIYTSNNVPVQLAPTPFFNTVTINSSNPQLTADTRAIFTNSGLFDANGDAQVFIGRRMLEVGPRIGTLDSNATQLAVGLEGELDSGWNWDLHGHFNRSQNSNIQTGNVSISAFNAALASGTCDIFGPNQFSQACSDMVSRTGAIVITTEQTNLVGTIGGDLGWTLPRAETPVKVVFGAEYREDFGFSNPDSVLGPDVAGFNQSLPVKGRVNVVEAFGEVYVPIIEGASWADELSINGAYRYSDYSTIGGVTSFAVGAEWAPNSQVRFRAQFQEAVRAPNIAELFSPVTNGFPGAVDPCAMVNGDPATATLAGCTGAPGAAAISAAVFNTAALQPNSQTQGNFGGNANLTEETAQTVTIGFVAQPAAIEGLTVTVDYYQIEGEDFVGTVPIQSVLDGCYINGVTSFCNLIQRQTSGIIDFVSLTNQNLAERTSEGVDIQADYSWDVGPNTFGIDYVGGFKIEDGRRPTANDIFVDCAGAFGGNFGRCGEPQPEYKHTARFDWVRGPLLASLRWRYLSEVEVDDNLNPLDADGGSDLRSNTIDSYNYFDLSGQYDLNETLTLSGGITNLFDEDPPELGDCCSQQANTYPATYETLGRTFFVGAKAKF